MLSTTPRKPDLSWVDVEDSPINDSDEEVAIQNQKTEKIETINKLLSLDGHPPIKRTLNARWTDATPKTTKYYVSKMEEIVSTALEIVAPNDAGLLWRALKDSPGINLRYNETTADSSLLYAMVESYNQATHSSTRKNILSIIADKLSFRDLEKLIPGISRHHFTAARRHAAQFGASSLSIQIGSQSTILRQRIDPNQVEHFIEFITSQNIIQDLPFGRRKLRLSSGEDIDIPNVIRLLIPSRLIDQYLRFCQETNFNPLGKRTLFKIISESCGASVRKCLRGLDNFLAEGTKAFDELKAIVDKIPRDQITDKQATELKEALVDSKQYLKGDYNVRTIISCNNHSGYKIMFFTLQVHVSFDSTVADHCITFAMSDEKEKKYKAKCDHEHNQTCDRCSKLHKVRKL